MATIKPKWKCGICDSVHEEKSDAICCWRNCVRDDDADVFEVYFCPLCDEGHAYEEEAIACCGYEPDASPPLTTAEELEAAGQARLVP